MIATGSFRCPDRTRSRWEISMTGTRSRIGLAALAALALGAAVGMASPAQAAGRGHTLPASFQWRSSGVLMSPKPDANHPIVSVKDPTVVRYKGQWLVYATTANTSGNWSLQYTGFRTW